MRKVLCTNKGSRWRFRNAVRTVFVIGPDKEIKLMLSYPMSTGRDFDEAHRQASSLNARQLEPGDDVIISSNVSDDDAWKKYPGGWKAPRRYLRIVPQPR
jgi:alkyl hydroperoxide reductase subunit AhpC